MTQTRKNGSNLEKRVIPGQTRNTWNKGSKLKNREQLGHTCKKIGQTLTNGTKKVHTWKIGSPLQKLVTLAKMGYTWSNR